MKNLVILISGRGSNLKAIIDAVERGKINARISLVLSNKKDALGLRIAQDHGIKTKFIDPSFFETRRGYDLYIAELVKKHQPDLVVLAGYMRILSDEFIDTFEGKIINVHPSLIPAFQGKNAQRQAFEYGTLLTGCSIHFVTKQLDNGPIIVQAVVPISPEDTVKSLEKKILSFEHRAYPQAIKWIVEDRVLVEGRKVIVKGARYGTIPVNPELEDF
ncbi:MAG: phosphoribosylglycinamide formyltransferase [Hydrogenothermaceae bacterium]|nr:phosphoribosylglycinamide formyltransferase [Hydrogenothermaceae bacterium]